MAETCSENVHEYTIQMPDDFGGPYHHDIHGPHHWVRIGTHTDHMAGSNPPSTARDVSEVTTGIFMWIEIKPTWECVYCLEERREQPRG